MLLVVVDALLGIAVLFWVVVVALLEGVELAPPSEGASTAPKQRASIVKRSGGVVRVCGRMVSPKNAACALRDGLAVGGAWHCNKAIFRLS